LFPFSSFHASQSHLPFLCRSNLVAKLIFLDQLCEISPYLPRSSLEAYVPYAILRSIYSQYYSNSPSMPLALLSVSPRHSPAVSLSHTSPAVNHFYDMDSGSLRSTDNKHRNVHRSGPLDYSSSRKVKLVVEGSTFGSTGCSPLPRFAVSRSGPLMYK
jgi:NCK-associated protein 1